ncbi:MAG: UDP-N-acetylmuramoyl-tripeptide--D-alanyl-D-alanine ligase [Flavobacteriaceae bacterium]|nr:UDP-N-acetylmuramoyl-tripeptide--D-alanyl-D-alanine ligase [Eudoraea sp.]NNJ38979.1 UDP-N-acetylmuramoyl-tripeptide--D-alanyl-D-alanine ligase [Flavobacteriaceae bacterium]
MTIEALHTLFLETPKACTDTRKIEGPCIFFALKGDNFNGNKFALSALEKGAAYAVVDEPEIARDRRFILVPDALKALQDLALFHRNYFGTKVLALTGSNGKTTTKELIHAVLNKKYNTIATQGNLNNHIGVPLTLLTISEETEIAVVEMGANHQREIAFLCTLAEPDFGYITNYGKAHLEGFGGIEGVIKGKSEMYDNLISRGKFVFFNADDPIQSRKLEDYPDKVGYSQKDKNQILIDFIGAQPHVKLRVDDTLINTQLIGQYNFGNCCAAILIGKYFEVTIGDIKTAIENYLPMNNRSQFISRNGLEIVLDAYNANPSSMQVALENFDKMEGDHKIVFLGDMFELGDDAQIEHQQIAELAASMKLEQIFLVGEHFFKTQSRGKKFKDFKGLSEYLKAHPIVKGSLLIKASRGMALERILDLL